jgi:Flp pilus assembly protein TadD
LALANYQLSQKKYPEAQASVNELLQKSPQNADGMAMLGQIQFNKGEKGQAVATFRALAAANPKSSSAQIMLAEALSGNGDRAGAQLAARKAMELQPESPQPYGVLIAQQIADGKPTDALSTARSFGAGHPGPDADLLMADTNFRLNHKDEAVGILTKAQAAKPDKRYVARLAQFAISSDDTKRAAALYADWLAKNPTDVGMRRDYASLLLSAGDQAAARREFETVLKQAPQDAVALNNLGWILQKEDPARALSMVSQAAKLAPRSPQIADTLGWMKLQSQDRQSALPLLQRAHDLDSRNPEIGYHLAVALDANGKRVEAKALLVSVLQANPKFDGVEDAKQLVARW